MTSTTTRYVTDAEYSRRVQLRALRRQRDRKRFAPAWYQMVNDRCVLCRDGHPDPRCAACVLRGLRP
jgi:hypothetical protein